MLVRVLQPAGCTGQGRMALLSAELGVLLRRSMCGGPASESEQHLAEVGEPMLTVCSAARVLVLGSVCKVL